MRICHSRGLQRITRACSPGAMAGACVACGAVACVWPVLTHLLGWGHKNRTRGAAQGPSSSTSRGIAKCHNVHLSVNTSPIPWPHGTGVQKERKSDNTKEAGYGAAHVLLSAFSSSSRSVGLPVWEKTKGIFFWCTCFGASGQCTKRGASARRGKRIRCRGARAGWQAIDRACRATHCRS